MFHKNNENTQHRRTDLKLLKLCYKLIIYPILCFFVTAKLSPFVKIVYARRELL